MEWLRCTENFFSGVAIEATPGGVLGWLFFEGCFWRVTLLL